MLKALGKTKFMAKGLKSYGSKMERDLMHRADEHIYAAPSQNQRTGDLRNDTIVKSRVMGIESGKINMQHRMHLRWQDIRLRSAIYNKVTYWYYHKIAEYMQWHYKENARQIVKQLQLTFKA